MSIEIISTEDGSHTLRHQLLEETYHSVHGAIRESMHVYVEAGFLEAVAHHGDEPLRIFELGFGTGLNALLTLLQPRDFSIDYVTVEAYPLLPEVYQKLNYPAELGKGRDPFSLIHKASWGKMVEIEPGFNLQKIEGKIQGLEWEDDYFDLVYYDAFAPSKQPEMWELPVLEKVTSTMKPESVLVTYCAKGQFKRDLKALGLTLEVLPGPPGKFEMVRAIR